MVRACHRWVERSAQICGSCPGIRTGTGNVCCVADQARAHLTCSSLFRTLDRDEKQLGLHLPHRSSGTLCLSSVQWGLRCGSTSNTSCSASDTDTDRTKTQTGRSVFAQGPLQITTVRSCRIHTIRKRLTFLTYLLKTGSRRIRTRTGGAQSLRPSGGLVHELTIGAGAFVYKTYVIAPWRRFLRRRARISGGPYTSNRGVVPADGCCRIPCDCLQSVRKVG